MIVWCMMFWYRTHHNGSVRSFGYQQPSSLQPRSKGGVIRQYPRYPFSQKHPLIASPTRLYIVACSIPFCSIPAESIGTSQTAWRHGGQCELMTKSAPFWTGSTRWTSSGTTFLDQDCRPWIAWMLGQLQVHHPWLGWISRSLCSFWHGNSSNHRICCGLHTTSFPWRTFRCMMPQNKSSQHLGRFRSSKWIVVSSSWMHLPVAVDHHGHFPPPVALHLHIHHQSPSRQTTGKDKSVQRPKGKNSL